VYLADVFDSLGCPWLAFCELFFSLAMIAAPPAELVEFLPVDSCCVPLMLEFEFFPATGLLS
jgi:hypothetical protein